MNEEQMEAAVAKMERFNRRMERLNGWRHGIILESRKKRIKRLRRWNRLEEHYPDRFVPQKDHHWSHTSFKLVDKLDYRGVELFVTSAETTRPPKITDLNSFAHEFPPFEDWPKATQYNGYCRFKSKPVIESGYKGILTYIPVHGGITYAYHEQGVSTYGFDTAHSGDENNPLVRNVEWVGHQCAIMAASIRVAALFERDYLRFKDAVARARVIDRYHSRLKRLLGAEFNIQNNFGAMINVLFGNL